MGILFEVQQEVNEPWDGYMEVSKADKFRPTKRGTGDKYDMNRCVCA